MKYDELIKNTINNYCKMFNISKKELKDNLDRISKEDDGLIKNALKVKKVSLEEFRKEFPDVNKE